MTVESFGYTGSPIKWTVPVGVESSYFVVKGAQGGRTGGEGGISTGTLSVTAGQILWLYVGEYPGSAAHGGWNGGGSNYSRNSGGGGASDIRLGGKGLNDRIIVAGGGGAGSGFTGYFGGDGGGLTGEDATNDLYGGGGGTQSKGGSGGRPYSSDGSKGEGGGGNDGGGGGGGYYGGGQGSYTNANYGGGGGSGYIGGVTNGSTSQGGNTGHGQIKLTYTARIDSTMDAAAPAADASFAGELEKFYGDLNAAAPAPDASFTAMSASNDYISADAPAPESSFSAIQVLPGSLNAVAPAPNSTIEGAPGSRGELNAEAPAALASFGASPKPTPTWQAVAAGDDFRRSAEARIRSVSSRVDILGESGEVILEAPISSGNVSCDASLDERWKAEISVTDLDLLPQETTDLLHPVSGNRVRIWWQLMLENGFLAEVPLGTYYPSSPSISHERTGVAFKVALLDIVARIRRNKWSGGDSLDLSGMTVSDALHKLLRDRAPLVSLDILPTEATLPEIYEVGEPGRDPWADVLKICEAGSYMVYSNRVGTIVGEPIPIAEGTPKILLSLGEQGRMVKIDRALDDSELFNVVTVRSTNTDVDPPVWATVEDSDPNSSLNASPGHRYPITVDSDTVTTTKACRDLASIILSESRALLELVDVVMQSRPDIDPYDLVTVTDNLVGATGTYQASSWSLDLSPGSLMRMVAFQRRLEV